VHWSGPASAVLFRITSKQLSDVAIQHLMEPVLDSEPEPESEVVEASSFLCLCPELPALVRYRHRMCTEVNE
jgi:hypothetical protein